MIKPKKLVSFADRLKQARLDMGARLSREVRQKEIAAEMGVEPSAYSQWEGGVKEPRGRATYERLAKILGIDSGWLAFGTETDTRAKGESITKKRDGGAKEA